MTLEQKLKLPKVKIDIGSGNVNMKEPVDEWIRVDAMPLDNVDIQADAKSIPLEDKVADELWLGDSIEHFPTWHHDAIMGELNRILKVGGVIGGSTPNFHATCKRYASGEMKFGDAIQALYGGFSQPFQQHYMTFTADIFYKFLPYYGFEKVDLSESPGSDDPNEAWWLVFKATKTKDFVNPNNHPFASKKDWFLDSIEKYKS